MLRAFVMGCVCACASFSTLAAPMSGHGREACVSLQVDDADAYYDEWRGHVPSLHAPRNEQWGARTFGVTDPFGNTIFVMGPPK